MKIIQISNHIERTFFLNFELLGYVTDTLLIWINGSHLRRRFSLKKIQRSMFHIFKVFLFFRKPQIVLPAIQLDYCPSLALFHSVTELDVSFPKVDPSLLENMTFSHKLQTLSTQILSIYLALSLIFSSSL